MKQPGELKLDGQVFQRHGKISAQNKWVMVRHFFRESVNNHTREKVLSVITNQELIQPLKCWIRLVVGPSEFTIRHVNINQLISGNEAIEAVCKPSNNHCLFFSEGNMIILKSPPITTSSLFLLQKEASSLGKESFILLRNSMHSSDQVPFYLKLFVPKVHLKHELALQKSTRIKMSNADSN